MDAAHTDGDGGDAAGSAMVNRKNLFSRPMRRWLQSKVGSKPMPPPAATATQRDGGLGYGK
ncbi:hypothetical protein [Micromonospora sp. NBS 11-29]|uniref:hypothetical protein n=1 Tax=Micromonospora sp. NBS 11-29 TaxID=1960879 RepID=UPI001121BAD4|nr:hypothetical protein [Micromonospora sp. NBS 11-29]